MNKNTPWYEHALKKYGSDEAIREEMARRREIGMAKLGTPEEQRAKLQEWQAKSRLNYSGTGGFGAGKLGKERAKKYGALGAKVRWGKHDS